MKIDLAKFENVIPYASELYGIYQPLLGWQSQTSRRRLVAGFSAFKSGVAARLLPRITPRFEVPPNQPVPIEFRVERGEPTREADGPLVSSLDSVIGRRVADLIQQFGPTNPSVWRKYTGADELDHLLQSSHDAILQEYRSQAERAQIVSREPARGMQLFNSVLARESMVAGVLNYLNQHATPEQLMGLLYSPHWNIAGDQPYYTIGWVDPDKAGLDHAVLSPIGVVHLFRQYFFEFDSFLGPSVQHVWLSPGGTVELVEVSTRKTVIERTVEQAFETMDKSEKESRTQDELSDAVRSENSSDTKLGVSANQSFTYGLAFVNGSTSVGVTFNMDEQQKQAREQTHKGLRQQTEKLSSEIRKSYKTAFRTVTETTDLNSRRYVLQNTNTFLMNYELRRKMRQVGVQVQDYGTQLCWQSYVDDPASQLGVARLVHIAQPSDLQPVREPDMIPPLEQEIAAQSQTMSAEWIWESRVRNFVNSFGFVPIVPPKAGYIYSRAQITRVSGESWAYDVRPRTPDDLMGDVWGITPEVEMIDTGDGSTERSVRTVAVGVEATPAGIKTDAHPTNAVQVTLFFKPSRKLVRDVEAENNKRLKDAKDKERQAFQDALFKAARERVKLASNIQPRRMEDLREEERIVVYRVLIHQLITSSGAKVTDSRVQHLFAELVQAVFDIDRMLYFVAPEWWVPRATPFHESPQSVGVPESERSLFEERHAVDWGGAKEHRPDNYYITEDSASAKLGSSLGWILQLDGDNMRNAFLNAPWVKAVVPIRPGQEWKALTWLSDPSVEGADGLDAKYAARDDVERQQIINTLHGYTWSDASLANRYAALVPAEITILDALRYLVIRIQEKQRSATTKISDPDNPAVGYLPTDRVFEHGFDPLQGGFTAASKVPYEVFDQWVEVVPTDQIVPVAVEYDPKTGLQKG